MTGPELDRRVRNRDDAKQAGGLVQAFTSPVVLMLMSVTIAASLYLSITTNLESGQSVKRLDAIEQPTPERQHRALERAIGELSTKQAGKIVRKALHDDRTRRELRGAF